MPAHASTADEFLHDLAHAVESVRRPSLNKIGNALVVSLAQAAVKLIEVEYEDLPVYTDPEEACKPGSIAIHEDFDKYRKMNFIVGSHLPRVGKIDFDFISITI